MTQPGNRAWTVIQPAMIRAAGVPGGATGLEEVGNEDMVSSLTW